MRTRPPARAGRVLAPLVIAVAIAAGVSAGATAAAPSQAGGIVFASERDGDWEIYATTLDGRRLAQLTRNGVDDTRPVPSPDGSRIAFSRGYDLWVMRRDGSGQRRVARQAGDPTWAPDGRRLAFDSWRRGATGLVVADADGGRARVIHPRRHSAPAWSPRGDRILFGDGRALFTVRAEGGGLSRVAGASLGYGARWTWSPDGRRVAYAASGAVVVSSPEGRQRRRVSPAVLRGAGDPAWSPDGRRIAFSAWTRGGGPGIYVVNVSGGSATRIVAGEGSGLDWSSDGRSLVFTREGPSYVDAAADLLAAAVATRRARTVFSAHPHGGAAGPRRLPGLVPRRAVVPPPPLPIARGGVLHAPSRIVALSADGPRVAVTATARRNDCLPPVVVWQPQARVTPIGARGRGCAMHWTGAAALAGARVALVSGYGGNNTEVSLDVATLARPRLVTQASAIHQADSGGSYLGNLRGDADTLAFNAWEACAEADPGQCDPDWELDRDSIWVLGGGRQTCPQFERGSRTCSRVRSSTTLEELVDVDRGRLVVVRDEDALVASRDGSVLAAITPPVSTRILTARLHGGDLVLLRTTPTGSHVLAVRSASGAVRTTRPLQGADSAAGDARCGRRPFCGDAELRLADLHDGVALYLHGRDVHLLRLSDGRDVKLTPPGSGRVHAELDDAGLFYSYTVAGAWPGRVQFRTWNDVRALFP